MFGWTMVGLVSLLLGMLQMTVVVMGESSGPMTGTNICRLGRIVAVLETVSGSGRVASADDRGKVIGSPSGACRCDIKGFLSCTVLPAKDALPQPQPDAPFTCSNTNSCA